MPILKINTASQSMDKNFVPYKHELSRKALHILALVIPAGMLVLDRNHSLLILGLASATALGVDILRARLAVVNYWILKIFGSLMRPGEKSDPEAKVILNGSTWVLISAFLLVLIFPVHVAAVSFAMFIIGDGAAALAGRRYGRIFWGNGNKTLEGSAAFLGAAMLVVLIVPGVKFWIGAAGALAACLAEAMPGPLNDNLRAPLSAAVIMVILEYIF